MKQEFRYESEYKSAKKQNKQEAIEFILGKNYGEIVTFDQLSKILQYNLADENEKRKFRGIMNIIKNYLINYGYVLKTVTNVGYYILKPQHISSYTFRNYMEKPLNLLEKAERILDHIDTSSLSDIRMKEREEVIDLNKDLFVNFQLLKKH